MLRHRVIPVVLLDGYSVIKTINFDVRRNLGNPITIARIYNTRNVDELVLLDIDASKGGLKIDEYTIEDVASECFMPLAVGGGLRTIEDISGVLAKGADKVVLNTIALDEPSFIREASEQFGAQCIVVSIDVTRQGGKPGVFSHAGREVDLDPTQWARQVESLGAGEIFLNSVDKDGEMKGCDLELIESVSSAVGIPVIAMGGLGSTQDAARMIKGGASAVAAASVFHFTSITPDEIKAAIDEAGYPVRL